MRKTDIQCVLIGLDGNAFAIMGRVIEALRRGGRADLIEEYKREAMRGDYNHLLLVTMEFVEVI